MAKEKTEASKKSTELNNKSKQQISVELSEEANISEPEKVVKHPKRSKFFIVSGTFLVLAILLATIVLVIKKGSLAQIKVGSLMVPANISQKRLEKQISQTSKEYKLKIKYPDGSVKSYAPAEAGIATDPTESAKNAKKQLSDNFFQRLRWWSPIKIPLKSRVDQAKLDEFIHTKTMIVKVASKDASITINDGTASITKEEKGSGYALTNAPATIVNTVTSMSKRPLQLKLTTLNPSIISSSLKPSQDRVNTLLAQKVIFNLEGHSVLATPSDIAGWLEITPVRYAKTSDVNIDSGKVEKYIDKIAKPYVQPPRSRLITKTTEGYVVLDSGANGVDVVNKSQSAAEVVKAISASKPATINLSVKYAAAKTVETEPHSKWLVVDISTKRMYAYENTSLIKTFLISAGAPKTPTVQGKFAIYSKFKSQDMRGLNADGSRYFQPKVPYVNYFYKDYAVHGNYWRAASYFGNINSSHGCVGVRSADSAWVYNWAPIGTPVIVHS